MGYGKGLYIVRKTEATEIKMSKELAKRETRLEGKPLTRDVARTKAILLDCSKGFVWKVCVTRLQYASDE